MEYLSNAHTHSTFCDGKATIEEMVQQALALGFTDLGFSSHSPAPFDPSCPGIQDEKAYKKAVKDLARQNAGKLVISLGVEWDFFSDLQETYDYTIGSVHYFSPRNGEYRSVDQSPELLEETLQEWFQGDVLAMVRDYYQLVIQHVRQNHPTIVGHFDLIAKFNDRTHYLDEVEEEYQSIAAEALLSVARELKTYGGMVEVNTGGVSRGWKQTAYPDDFLLTLLQQENIPIILSSDSHEPATLSFGFKEELERLRKLGFQGVTVLTNGKFEKRRLAKS